MLSGVDLDVGAGEFVSIVGPSGCGKSTLLRIVAGLIPPSAGELTIEDRDVRGRPGAAAYMAQQDLLFPWRRALDNAILAAEVHGMERGAARDLARSYFARFGLDGFEDVWPAELSGGMRQRLALLRTFLADRSLLLLDEPFGALDAITRRGMWRWLIEVLESERRSVLFVTHDIDEALMLSDRILVMSNRPGRFVAEIVVKPSGPRDDQALVQEWFIAHKAELLKALGDAHVA